MRYQLKFQRYADKTWGSRINITPDSSPPHPSSPSGLFSADYSTEVECLYPVGVAIIKTTKLKTCSLRNMWESMGRSSCDKGTSFL